MAGRLSVTGVGPGDPELLTLKAVRVIKEADVLCVPKGRESGSSLALSIVEKALPLEGKEVLEAYFPMKKTMAGSGGKKRAASGLDEKWDKTVSDIHEKLKEGKDVVFPTLGDPSIYSTFFYLYDRLLDVMPGLEIEIIPGVSSINAAASRANIPLGLGNEKIAVLPANYMDKLKETLKSFDTVVLMKVNKVFKEILEVLSELDLAGKAVCVSRAGMEDEMIYGDIEEVEQEGLNYFSMVIVRK